MITANPGSVGEYEVLIVDAGASATYDTGKTFSIASVDDSKYVSCAAPTNRGKPNANLACSFVPLSYETALEVFGKGVANRFIAVQVTVRNKNSNLEYLLQDVRIGQPEFVLSSYDRKIPRAVSEKEEQFSSRAIIVRLTAATASILTGIAGFAGNDILQDAANIVAGPFQTGIQSAIPNLSATELTRMDDLGFSTASTVIPKNSAISVVAFIPSDTVEPVATTQTHWYRPNPKGYATYTGKKLQEFFSTLTVSVAGTHVQETDPSKPTLKLFIPADSNSIQLSSAKAGSTPFTTTIEGSSLDGVAQVQLTNRTDTKTVLAGKLQTLSGETTPDPNVASLVIQPSPMATVGVYDVAFILADGSTVKTGQTVSITPSISSVNPSHAAIGAAVTIAGDGFGAAKGSSTVSFSGKEATPSAWSNTSITVTVPANAPNPASLVLTVAGVSSSSISFPIP